MGMRWLLGIILLAVIALILSWFGPINAPAQSERMGASIEKALNDAGLGDVNVKMKGNVAHLAGEVLSEDTIAQAISLAENADCEACRNSEPDWHRVKSAMTVKAPPPAPVINTVSPYVFSATKTDGGSILLDGYVRSENELNRILREAETLFPGNVVNDKLTVAEGAPNTGWGNIISKYLPFLALMDKGSLVLDDAQSLLTGSVSDEAIRNQIIGDIDDQSGYNEVVNVTVPNAAPVFAGTASSQGLCQKLFDDLKGDTKINFELNSDSVTSESFGLLDSLSSAAKQCPSFSVEVTGHTDNTGDASYNQNLSERRAQRVVDYLIEKGVDANRLSSVGLGETRPVADNETREGREANRRIEFTVNKSE